jgi:hypothetical protein
MYAGDIKVPIEPDFKALFNLSASKPFVNTKDFSSASYMETFHDQVESPTTESLTLTKFLMNNVHKLKILRINDHSIKVGNLLTDDLPNLSLAFLRLQKYTYSIDDSGQQYILSCQRQLEQLNGTGFVFDYVPEDIERFFGGVCKNYRSLTAIRIYPNVIFSEGRHSKTMEEILSSVSIDCEVFIQCPVLVTLHIDLNVVENKSGNNDTIGKKSEINIRKIGLIHNLHTLPEQLRNIIIYGHILNQEDVQLLMGRLHSFTDLKTLTLGISYSDLQENRFIPAFEWVQSLLKLGFHALRVAKFIGCNETENIPDYQKIKSFADTNGILIENQMLGKSRSLSFMF